jgi:putative oxidoreductase
MVDMRTFIRPLLAAPFLVGGLNAVRSPRPLADKSADVLAPIAEAVGLPKDPLTLAKVNGAVQIGVGVAFACGVVPRVASLVLGASLVPTTLADHRFWGAHDATKRDAQLVHFAKNAGVLGGLLASALDTGGRPSLFWSGRRAAGNVARSVADTAADAYHTIPGVS